MEDIVNAMHTLTIFMHIMVINFIVIAVILTGSKILYMEKNDFAIYKALGFTTKQLRLSFTLRFTIITCIGSIIGTILSSIFTDLFVSTLLKICGISDFTSNPSIIDSLFPLTLVIASFSVFAYLSAGKIKKADVTSLIRE